MLFRSKVGTGWRLGMLHFDLGFVPAGANITSATLVLDHVTAVGGPAYLHRVTVPWSESTVTWNNLGSSFYASSSVLMNTGPVLTGPITADITQLAQQWLAGTFPNHGLHLRQALTYTTTYPSSEDASVALRPRLDVCYVVPAPNGAACTVPTDCASGTCVDGVCCNQACGGPCDVCSAALGASADGVCTPAPAGSPGSPACATGTCDGSSAQCSGGCAADTDCSAGEACTAGLCGPPPAWTTLGGVGAPSTRVLHTTVWTGDKLIVWGGQQPGNCNVTYPEGWMFDPATATWTKISSVGAPPGAVLHSAVWTGTRMLVWGGRANCDQATSTNVGALYDPVTNTWTPTSSVNAPAARSMHGTVWMNGRVMVWGGKLPNHLYTATGAYYDVASDTWTTTNPVGAPSIRIHPFTVWTGQKAIFWGGVTHVNLQDGALYDPATNSWTPMTTVGAPSGRKALQHTRAEWTGSRMLVWGGTSDYPNLVMVNDGGSYDPVGNTWSPIPTAGAPQARAYHLTAWTGSLLVVWGGIPGPGQPPLSTGGVFNPATNTWAPTRADATTPPGTYATAGLWTGPGTSPLSDRFVYWGGGCASGVPCTAGGVYIPGG